MQGRPPHTSGSTVILSMALILNSLPPPFYRLRPRLQSDTEVLDLEELLEAVLRPFAADARFLDAAEGRHFGRNDARIDPDDAVLERLGDAPDAADVAAVEIRREAEF